MPHRPVVVLVLLLAGALHAGTAHAASLPAGSTALLSGAPSLFDPLPAPAGYSTIDSESVSASGRWVAFTSSSDGLSEEDDDFAVNVYVKDRQNGSVTLVSRATGLNGEPAHAACDEPAISDNGQRVAFVCRGGLDPADTNDESDVYVRDLPSATTILVSRDSNLQEVGDAASYYPSLSATGEHVAFTSDAKNFDANPSGGQQVYRRHIGGGNETILVSRTPAAAGAKQMGGRLPSISDDGDRIAFEQHEGAPKVDPADTNTFTDIYVRDVGDDATILASRADGDGDVGNAPSQLAALSGNGEVVAFESKATNFDNANDNDPQPDIYTRRVGGSRSTALVSINAAGYKGDTSTAPSINTTGDVVAFLSKAVSLHPDDTNPIADAYVKDINTIRIASRADGTFGTVANGEAESVAVSGDGTKVGVGLRKSAVVPGVEPRVGSVMLRDFAALPLRTFAIARPPGDEPFVNEGGTASGGALTPDGRYAAFFSAAPALGLPDDVPFGIFRRDRVTGDVVLASRTDGSDGAAFAGIFAAQADISDDGRRVAFTVAEAGVPRQVYVRDVVEGRTWLASQVDGPSDNPGNGASDGPSLDADGSRVAFESVATNLGDGDDDPIKDVHAYELGGETVLVSRATGFGGTKGNQLSQQPSISADGTKVAFLSLASNLSAGDTDAINDVHVRYIEGGTTRLVSAAPDGTKANSTSNRPRIDASGARIAFESVATNLLGATSPNVKVFVRDLAADTLLLASRADGVDADPANTPAFNAGISPDGRYVAFTSSAGNLAPGTPAGILQAYRRDLEGGRTELASRRSGPDGEAATRNAFALGISDAGGCVSFQTADALLGSASENTQVYMRAFRADCAVTDPAPDAGPGDEFGAGGQAEGPGGPVARDALAPTLSDASLVRRRFRVARGATALTAAARRGTVLRFRSSEAGTLTVAIHRLRRGRRPRRAGTLTRRIAAGPGRVRLTGRLGRRRMAAGRYRLTATATDAAGNRSAPVRLRFVIV